MATTTGAGISHDSVAYLGAARSLLDGRGLSIPFGAAHPIPFTHWPPLYPLLLAAAGLLTNDIDSAARWFSSALFALNIILVAVLARKFTNSASLGYGAAFLFASCWTMVILHTLAMREPLFIFLVLVAIYFPDEHLTTGELAPLLLAAASAGLSTVTRYAGIPFIAGGVMVLFLRNPSSRKSLIDAAVWALVTSAPLPLVAWRMRVAAVAGGRVLRWHPPDRTFFIKMLAGVAECVLPRAVPHRNWVVAAACVVLAPMIAKGIIRRYDFRLSYLTLFIAIYVAFIVVVGFVADPTLDQRAMEPMFPLLILLAAATGSRLLKTGGLRMAVAAGVCAAIALPNFPAMLRWIADSSRDGIGFNARQWRESPTIAFIRSLPANKIIYTNLPEPVYFLTGRAARFLPAIGDPVSQAGVAAAETDAAVAEIARHSPDVAAVYFVKDSLRLPIMIAGPDLA